MIDFGVKGCSRFFTGVVACNSPGGIFRFKRMSTEAISVALGQSQIDRGKRREWTRAIAVEEMWHDISFWNASVCYCKIDRYADIEQVFRCRIM